MWLVTNEWGGNLHLRPGYIGKTLGVTMTPPGPELLWVWFQVQSSDAIFLALAVAAPRGKGVGGAWASRKMRCGHIVATNIYS